jgi:hypothetical protein
LIEPALCVPPVTITDAQLDRRIETNQPESCVRASLEGYRGTSEAHRNDATSVRARNPA